MTTYRVGYLVGSLAKASINRKLALALAHLAPEELRMEEISFAELPLYSYDFDADFPPSARTFKDAIAAVDFFAGELLEQAKRQYHDAERRLTRYYSPDEPLAMAGDIPHRRTTL